MSETEVERLKITMIADVSDIIQKSKAATKAYEDSVNKIEDLRKNSVLDDLFGPTGGGSSPPPKPPPTLDKEKMLAAVRRHEMEEARAAKEAISREKERVQVAKQLTEERRKAAQILENEKKTAARAQATYDKGAAKDFLKTENNIEDPMKKGSAAADTYSSALKGLAFAYGAFKVAQMASANDMEEFNYQMQEGQKNSSRLAEMESFRFGQTTEAISKLAPKERVAANEKELASIQKIAEGQRKAKEAAEERVRAARGPALVGSLVRSVNAGGRQTRLEEEEANLKAISGTLDATRSKVQHYQRTLKDLEVGGEDATNAFNAFNVKMDEQERTLGRGHKAILLARLETQNLSKEQLKAAEATFDRVDKMREEHEAAKQFAEMNRAEAKKESDTKKRFIEEYMTPQEKLQKKKEELDKAFANGLPMETYNRGLQSIQNEFDRTTQSAQKFHAVAPVSQSAYGSLEASSRIQKQTETRRDPNTDLLRKIERNTAKQPGTPVVKITPANIS